jgi:hypothetical protein
MSALDVLAADAEFRQAGILDPVDLHDLESLQTSQTLDYDRCTLVRRHFDSHQTKLNIDLAEFKVEFFDRYPELNGMDFSNLLVAGGAVGSCVLDSFRDPSDVDFFVYGLTVGEADLRVRKWLDELFIGIHVATRKLKIGNNYVSTDVNVVRNNNTISVTVRERKYQIIFRLYVSKSEILHGFDLGSSAIGFTGEDVILTSLGKFSYERTCNVVDHTRRSTTYEKRLEKYFTRGFNIVLPHLDVTKLSRRNLAFGRTDMCILPHLVFSYSDVVGMVVTVDNFFDPRTHNVLHYDSDSDYDGNVTELRQCVQRNLNNLIRGVDFFYWFGSTADVLSRPPDASKGVIVSFYEKLKSSLLRRDAKGVIEIGTVRSNITVEPYREVINRILDADATPEGRSAYVSDLISRQTAVVLEALKKLKTRDHGKIDWVVQNPGSQTKSRAGPEDYALAKPRAGPEDQAQARAGSEDQAQESRAGPKDQAQVNCGSFKPVASTLEEWYSDHLLPEYVSSR